jgi:cytosine/adenosine deaminase-related metal-dependent hydrolase/SAM-dependent methyltransferase
MSSSLSAEAISSLDGYRAWARSYDTEPNPMLCLEKRFLKSLLPRVRGLDVLDLGCGTARWMSTLAEEQPRSLLGVDSSPEMLAIAKAKVGSAATFVCSDCTGLDLPKASADLILCSFLLSYIQDSSSFLKQISAVLRPGGSAFITDLHPETVARLNWRRTVRVEDGPRELRTVQRTLDSIVQQCEEAGLQIKVCLQPPFAEPERSLFRIAGKEEYFEQIADCPAIYILQLQLQEVEKSWARQSCMPETVGTIGGARLGLGPRSSISCDVECRNSRIAFIREGEQTHRSEPSLSRLDLDGHLLFPGLINSHDHLEFALYPRLGRGFYRNFTEWAEDIHHPERSPILEHRQVPRETRMWWGGIRNLLCGVTTVCHHNPYEPSIFEDDFVVRIVREYGWAHSLPLDTQAASKKRDTPKGQPFLIHLGEGIDDRSTQEIFELHESGALDEQTVLIHGLGLNAEGRALARSSGAGLIWCPSSNVFLFGKTLSFDEIQEFPYSALGSDSPLTCEGDLLDEIRFARSLGDVPADELFNCVTQNASQLLRLRNGEGTLRVGSGADLIAVRDAGGDPADTLSRLSYKDIELVLVGGRVQLASEEMMLRLPAKTTIGLEALCVESSLRWIRAPLHRLFEETKAYLGDDLRLGGKRITLGN